MLVVNTYREAPVSVSDGLLSLYPRAVLDVLSVEDPAKGAVQALQGLIGVELFNSHTAEVVSSYPVNDDGTLRYAVVSGDSITLYETPEEAVAFALKVVT